MEESTSYDAIGTVSSPATLTAAYTGNQKALYRRLMPKWHLDISYVPKAAQTNRYVDILVEFSNDGTNYYPLTTVVPTVVEIGDYVSGTDSTTGIPIIVPGDKTSTGGTAYKATYDGENVSDWFRISAREDGSANFGTLYVRAAFNT